MSPHLSPVFRRMFWYCWTHCPLLHQVQITWQSHLFLMCIGRGHGHGLLEDLLVHRPMWAGAEEQLKRYHVMHVYHQWLYLVKKTVSVCTTALEDNVLLNLNWVSGLPCIGFLTRLGSGLSCAQVRERSIVGSLHSGPWTASLITCCWTLHRKTHDLVCRCWCMKEPRTLTEESCVLLS